MMFQKMYLTQGPTRNELLVLRVFKSNVLIDQQWLSFFWKLSSRTFLFSEKNDVVFDLQKLSVVEFHLPGSIACISLQLFILSLPCFCLSFASFFLFCKTSTDYFVLEYYT